MFHLQDQYKIKGNASAEVVKLLVLFTSQRLCDKKVPKCSEVGPFFGLVEMNSSTYMQSACTLLLVRHILVAFFGRITTYFWIWLSTHRHAPHLSAAHTQTMFVRVQTNFFPSVAMQCTHCKGNCAGVHPPSTVMTPCWENRTGGNGYSC